MSQPRTKRRIAAEVRQDGGGGGGVPRHVVGSINFGRRVSVRGLSGRCGELRQTSCPLLV